MFFLKDPTELALLHFLFSVTNWSCLPTIIIYLCCSDADFFISAAQNDAIDV